MAKISGIRFMTENGFTLVELVAIIMLLGIMAAVATPRFFGKSAFEERGVYDEVVAAARYAQKLAITNRCTVQLTLTSNRFTLAQSNTTACSGPYGLAVPHPGRCRSPVNPAVNEYDCNTPTGVSITLTGCPSPIVFTSLGATTDAATCPSRTVQVGSKSFDIVGGSGFVQVPP